jgi:multiple sugar transport system substrate-binding protein
VFDKYGIAVPTTWAEYAAAAQKLHAANPNDYITNDPGDPGIATGMIWQAGGKPFSVDGTKVAINLQDAGVKKYTEMWNPLVEKKLVSPITSWSDDWFKALSSGTIATLVTGAWMPANLESSVPQGAGKWRVAPMPTYDGTATSAENGGSSQAVMKQSKNPVLAAAFVKWLNNSKDSIDLFTKLGGFPSTTADLDAASFQSTAPSYFGGQKINQVLVAASKAVPAGFQFLPYQAYAISIFADTVGQSYASNGDLNPGFVAWQKQLVTYGTQQGFTVTSG